MPAVPDQLQLQWFKSTHSGGSGSDCVEAARGPAGRMFVRDSKRPDPVIAFPSASFASFLSAVKRPS